MVNAPVISNFLTVNKTGLVIRLVSLAKEKFDIYTKHKEIKNLDIKTGLSFNGLNEVCSASFSDEFELKRLHFSFHNKNFTKNLSILFDQDLNFVRTSFVYSKTGRRHHEGDRHRLGAILEEDLIKVLMARHTGHKEVMEELLPEIHITGVYDFTSESFKQRVSLANMVLI
jgi:hypothetical protein